MKALTEIIKVIFAELELKYLYAEEQSLFSFRLKTQNSDVNMVLRCDDAQQMISCFADFPVKIPKVKHIAVLRAINVINYNYYHATLTLDELDGQLMARSCMNTDEGAVNRAVVIALIYGCLNIIDLNLNDILSLIYKDEPQVFIEEIITNQKVINGLN